MSRTWRIGAAIVTIALWSPGHALAQEDAKLEARSNESKVFTALKKEFEQQDPKAIIAHAPTYTERVTAARVAPRRAIPLRFLDLMLQPIKAGLSFRNWLSKTLSLLPSTRNCDSLGCSNRPREVVLAVSRTVGITADLEADPRGDPDNSRKPWGNILWPRSGISKFVSVARRAFHHWSVTGNWMLQVLGSFYDDRVRSASEERLVVNWPERELVNPLGRNPGEEVTPEPAPEDVRVDQPSHPLPLDLGSRTALYDIQAHTVYLPNGERLEAHSGIGKRLDDPRYVHEKNRGATPPNVYEIAPRPRLFHGVAALRLRPVGGGSMFGRSGMLAHSYMLGARGDSHGCVVFKDYPRFLQAFRSGEVSRLVVVRHLNDPDMASVRNRPGVPISNPVWATGTAAASALAR